MLIPLMLLTIVALLYDAAKLKRMVELGVPEVNVKAATLTFDASTGRLSTMPAARLFMFAKLLPTFVDPVSSMEKTRSREP